MPEWVLQMIGFGIIGGGAYAAIRSDLGALHAKVESAAASASAAHRRLDDCMARERFRNA